MRRCPGCLTPLPPLTTWCSTRCWRDDEGPGFDREDNDIVEQQEGQRV